MEQIIAAVTLGVADFARPRRFYADDPHWTIAPDGRVSAAAP